MISPVTTEPEEAAGNQASTEGEYPPPFGQQAMPEQMTPSAQQPYATAPAAVYVNVPKQGRGWIVGLSAVICLFLFALIALNTCNGALASLTGSGSDIVEDNSIAVIELSGSIGYDGTACSPEGLSALLQEAEDDDKIKAVVLRVNSGGGVSTAGEEMSDYVRSFSKPIVVSSASLNASAAYEISSQADYIFVANTTEIGAIGTALEITDISGFLDMLGINMETITSSDSKDSSYGYRPLTDEERAYYQAMVDQINEMFIETVAEGRDMDIEEVRALATGLSFTGRDAVGNGLADEVGTLDDAIDKAAELAGLSKYTSFNLGFDSYSISDLEYLL